MCDFQDRSEELKMEPTSTSAPASPPESRSRALLVACILGLPLAGLVLGAIHYGPVPEEVRRYVKHPVEGVEVAMFCVALGALAHKWWASRRERAACQTHLVPPWDGWPLPHDAVGQLYAGFQRVPDRLRQTWIGRRTRAVLDFLRLRGSAAQLDDHLRSLAEEDALALESSYALTRFLTWAMPILGFLGTVLGITESISGVTPEKLESDLSQVTDGLALAFDATALALGLTMVTMFLSFVVERIEQGILLQVDRYVERELAHRFQRDGAENHEYLVALRQNAEVILAAADRLVRCQAEVWAESLAAMQRRQHQAERLHHEKLIAALESALTRTLEAHTSRLQAAEHQAVERGQALTGSLAGVAQGIAAQAEALVRLQEQEGQLVRLQASLDQNLAALAGSGAFEQAVESLNAAIHLLTARSTGQPVGTPRPRPGAAA